MFFFSSWDNFSGFFCCMIMGTSLGIWDMQGFVFCTNIPHELGTRRSITGNKHYKCIIKYLKFTIILEPVIRSLVGCLGRGTKSRGVSVRSMTLLARHLRPHLESRPALGIVVRRV